MDDEFIKNNFKTLVETSKMYSHVPYQYGSKLTSYRNRIREISDILNKENVSEVNDLSLDEIDKIIYNCERVDENIRAEIAYESANYSEEDGEELREKLILLNKNLKKYPVTFSFEDNVLCIKMPLLFVNKRVKESNVGYRRYALATLIEDAFISWRNQYPKDYFKKFAFEKFTVVNVRKLNFNQKKRACDADHLELSPIINLILIDEFGTNDDCLHMNLFYKTCLVDDENEVGDYLYFVKQDELYKHKELIFD